MSAAFSTLATERAVYLAALKEEADAALDSASEGMIARALELEFFGPVANAIGRDGLNRNRQGALEAQVGYLPLDRSIAGRVVALGLAPALVGIDPCTLMLLRRLDELGLRRVLKTPRVSTEVTSAWVDELGDRVDNLVVLG